jgi:WD40 repeat protein
VRLFALPSGEAVGDLLTQRDSVESIALSSDGQLLATASKDRVVRLWQREGTTFQEILTLRSPTGPVVEMQFSPDGRSLALLVSKERAVRIWHIDRLRTRFAQMNLDW